MKARHARQSVRFMVLLSALALGLSGCRLSLSRAQSERTVFLPPSHALVLVIIVNPASLSAMRATGALLEASARPREQVIILSSARGAILASSRAPDSPGAQVPAPPASLPSHPTSFQKARYRQALQQYQIVLLRALAKLRTQEQQKLAEWATSTAAAARARPVLQRSQTASIGADLGAAVSDLSSLRQAGVGYGAPAVIAIIGVDAAAAFSAPTSPASLESSTVVVDDFPGTTEEEAAWQASLVQGGAARAVILTPATDDQLASVVEQGLDGAVTDTLTSVLFGLDRYQLQAAALPQLRQLRHLLTAEYPHATASINGYTDSLPAPDGNLLLSQRRAQAVQDWLVAHGVAVGRLQAFGYGDTDPVAPNTPKGQPLNRRVVVVIDPAASA
jgi:outer membrane protein OmpA-like peptidoglycan-associated protein